jgi:hypothetical protein
LQHYNQ